MFDISKVRGIIFDYGGTIDSNGMHWAEVIWNEYQDINVPITKAQFREAYVYGERYLATHPVIKSDHNFKDLLTIKVNIQFEKLIQEGYLSNNETTQKYSSTISNKSYLFAKQIIEKEKQILQTLKDRYPMVLVSNFYGNVQAVLKDFDLLDYFDEIVESAVVGIRKPDPAIFKLGIDKLNMPASVVVVIGDSHTKDIVPARENGCQTVWLKGIGWGDDDENATADAIITNFEDLRSIFQL